MVYGKAAVYTWKPLVYTCKPLLYKKKLKERCYLHSVQQSYEKNSCKPGIKYFTSVNCWFTLVNCQFTTCKAAVYTCKPLLYCNPPVYTCKPPLYCNPPVYERPLAEDSNFFSLFVCVKEILDFLLDNFYYLTVTIYKWWNTMQITYVVSLCHTMSCMYYLTHSVLLSAWVSGYWITNNGLVKYHLTYHLDVSSNRLFFW